MNDEIVTLNKGSTEYEGSPEQIYLDLISKFKFTEGYAKARIREQFVEERNAGCLVALDLCDRLCTLADCMEEVCVSETSYCYQID